MMDGYSTYAPYGRIVVPDAIVSDLENERLKKQAEEMARIDDEAFRLDDDDKKPDPAPEPETKVILKRPRPARMIQVFNKSQLAIAQQKWSKNKHTDNARAKLPAIEAATVNDGMRSIPQFKKLRPKFEDLRAEFQNLSPAVDHIEKELALATALPANKFRFSPVLLNGAPGIGKTAFAMRIADILGVEFHQLNAGGMQHAAQIFGTSGHWSESSPSPLFDRLAMGSQATFVLLIDEIDKVIDDPRYGILPAMLCLLEPESSRRLKCESTGIEHDLSRLIVIATSNDLGYIYPALLSRFSLIEVESPDEAQRRAIALRIHTDLAKHTRKKIVIDEAALDGLVRSDCDLRELTRNVKQAFIEAMMNNETVAKPVFEEPITRIDFGFLGGNQ